MESIETAAWRGTPVLSAVVLVLAGACAEHEEVQDAGASGAGGTGSVLGADAASSAGIGGAAAEHGGVGGAAASGGGLQPDSGADSDAASVQPDGEVGSAADGGEPDAEMEPDSRLPAGAQLVASSKSRLLALDVTAWESEALKEGNTQFALDLYGVLSGEATSDKNLFFSPHSISVALAMTYAGARNNTEAQMAETLHFALEQDRLHQAFNQLDLTLTSRADPGQNGQKGFRLNIVNAIWPQKDYAFLPDFLDVLAVHYGSALYALDFMTDPEDCRLIINDWVEEQTEERIEELIPEGIIDRSTRLVLTNAIYFNAAWREAFRVDATGPGNFVRPDGSQVSVPMMNQTASMPYAQGTGWKAVELPYERPEIGMVLILPDDFSSFEADLSASSLAAVLAELNPALVNIRMPRFSFASEFELNDALKALGMTDAFEFPTADFTGMTSVERLYIKAVIHKAFVDVNEAGTEAAASTAVIMADGGIAEVLEMAVDRPFVFLIWDRPTGAILFLGRVVDPS